MYSDEGEVIVTISRDISIGFETNVSLVGILRRNINLNQDNNNGEDENTIL